MTHVDQINQSRAQQIILFSVAFAVFHGGTKLQGFN
jgi:hypothetical protein